MGESMAAARRALVVEDDEGIASLWALALEDDGFDVQCPRPPSGCRRSCAAGNRT